MLGRRLGIARIQIDGSSEQNGGLEGGFESCGRATFPTKITQYSTGIRGTKADLKLFFTYLPNLILEPTTELLHSNFVASRGRHSKRDCGRSATM